MCEYIKDDGEQCGFDNHDGDYCHVHEDMVEDSSNDSSDADTESGDRVEDDEFHSAAFSGAQSDFVGQRMDTVCQQCKTSLRRRERVSQHPNRPRHLLFEAVVECDCSERVLGGTAVRKSDSPDGWY